MTEVVAPKEKISLLQFMVKQLFEKKPDLVTWYEDLPSLEGAAAAIGGISQDIAAIKKGFAELKNELKRVPRRAFPTFYSRAPACEYIPPDALVREVNECSSASSSASNR
jgi:hypothetical protein